MKKEQFNELKMTNEILCWCYCFLFYLQMDPTDYPFSIVGLFSYSNVV